jgi:integrase
MWLSKRPGVQIKAELLSLKWEDVDLEGDRLSVRRPLKVTDPAG